jgi:Fic family protein
VFRVAYWRDKSLFLYAYVRNEAVLSSQIEGTQSSLSDLLLFELDEAPGVLLDDVVEVSNRLIRGIHGVLLSRGRGSGGLPVGLRAGLAHVQPETMYPFLNGNGRVGRLLITFHLCHAGVSREPLLYFSLYFKQNRDTYYQLLDRVPTGLSFPAASSAMDLSVERHLARELTGKRRNRLFLDYRYRDILGEGTETS